jgi:hypothetical protein
MATSTNKTWKWQDATARTWSTVGNWLNDDGSPSDAAPSTAAVVTFNGGSASSVTGTVSGLTINGDTTLAGTSLTVSGDVTINAGTLNYNCTGALSVGRNFTNGGAFYQNNASTGSLVFNGASAAQVYLGTHQTRAITIAKTSNTIGGAITINDDIRCELTNTTASVFTFTSGYFIQIGTIYTRILTNSGATARTWDQRADVYPTITGAATAVNASQTTCTYVNRGYIRITQATAAQTLTFGSGVPSTCPMLSVESNVNYAISGNLWEFWPQSGTHTGAVTITVFKQLNSNGYVATTGWTLANIQLVSSSTTVGININNGVRFGTINCPGTWVTGNTYTGGGSYLLSDYCDCTNFNHNGGTATADIKQLTASNITLSGASSTYNMGVSGVSDMALTTTGGMVLSGASSTYNFQSVRGHNLTLSSSGTYNCYYYEHNYSTNPPTSGTVTHTGGTLVLKANVNSFSMSTWAFTSINGTRAITFEAEGYIVTTNTGVLNVDYGALTSVCPETDNAGFYHASSGSCTLSSAPSSPAAAFNLNWTVRCLMGVNYVKNIYNSYPRGDGLRIGGGLIGNSTQVTVNVSGNILLTGNGFQSGVVQNDTKWGLLNLTFWGGGAARTSAYITGYSDLAEGGEFRAFNTLTLAATYTGTLKLFQNINANVVTHQGGTLDTNGLRVSSTTYNSTDGTVNKYITNGAVTSANPDIYLSATSGTPWSFAYSSLLTCSNNVWVYVRGGTVSHGSTARSSTFQPSFDLTERVSAYTLSPNTDFRVGGLRINNYTVPNNSVWTIAGPEFTVYTGGLSSPANFTVNIVSSGRSGEICQMSVDNNTFTWPQVTINANSALVSSAWKFKNINIDSNTLTSDGQFVEVTGTLSSNSLGSGTLNATNSNWVFRGSGTVIGYALSSFGANVISDSTGTITFDGINGTNQGDQTAGFLTNFGGKIINNIAYNTSTGVGTLYLTAGSATDVTKPVASQIDFNYSTSSISFYLDRSSMSLYGFPIKGSTFNIGTSSAGYRYISGRSGNYSNWGVYNTESSTAVQGDYLNITNCQAKGGSGWYYGNNSILTGNNAGWTSGYLPTYSLSRSRSTVNEGSSVTITLTTTGLASGTLVPYTISGTGIESADINGANLAGNFTLNSSGIASVSLNITSDFITEGNQAFTLALNNGAASISVTIIDTSLTPTYSLTRTAAAVTEGESFTITLNTTNLPNGTTVPYTITGVSSSDINGASLTGNFTISGNTASLLINTTWDFANESAETLTLTVNPTYGTGTAISVVINNLPRPTYSLSASPTSINEGGNFTITLNTTNVADNTSVPYTITGTGIDSSDINGASLTGSFTIVSGTANVMFTATGDYLTEGDETLTLTLNSIGTNVSVLIADFYKTRTYFVGTSASTVFEGESFTITLNTTNVFNGTTVPYTITGVSSEDIGGASLSGNFTVNSNTALQNFTATLDLAVEGSETFTLTLGGLASGSINVTLKDPSTGTGGSFISFFED